LNELLANQTQLGIAGAAVLAQQINAGTLRPLFVAGTERTELFPDVPTGIEDGISDLEGLSNWFGLHGPKGLDPEIVATLNGLVGKALADQRVKEGLAAAGFFPVGGSPEALVARMEKDVALTEQVAAKAGIRIE
jgi:tripartite-type tricarboxylate transporter receptor subunit TctC